MSWREPPPSFRDLVDYCRERPEAVAARLLGETIFRVRGGRIFAFLTKSDRVAVTIKPRRVNMKRLLRRPEIHRARWIGYLGWVTVEVRDERALPLAHALIDESYSLASAPPRRRGAS